jgi:hypothetical protein
MIISLTSHAYLLHVVHLTYGRIEKLTALLSLLCGFNNVAMQQGVVETSTDAIGRTRSMMACWEVVVSLGHQAIPGSWDQRIMVMQIS